ncbi:putative glyoxalase superfamily protein PhnB [Kribbella voronezhensis]|uniref:Putative glyoxalase superfamily protein PhnB n=1 Tax=Kribbella voronezhensis TaxID=2512212 RepID=A0A4R7TCZ9_9ACTN|nr:VOC family protein [Kribbella voronezhensis]TDU90002.1 putative glyoxalase superfamily protein PhnB [Kribbella voronezhensis]
MTTERKYPGGKGTVTPYVAVRGAADWLKFVERAFETKASFAVPNEDGTIGHAEITIGDSVVMAFDAQPDWPDLPSLLSVYVDDADAAVARAVEAGATVITPLITSKIVGDRGARIRDPFGNIWWIQAHLYDVNPADLPALFADPAEAAAMKQLQESFAAEMRSRRG